VHHKKGRPSTATSHESRPGNPSFCIFWPPHWGSPRTAVGQITQKYRAWQALGILSQYKHKMLHNNTAQQRHSEKLASAPKASQIIPRAQGCAYIPIPTLKQRSWHEDTQAASLTDGNMDTHIIHIWGAHSPPPWLDLTTHTKQQTQQQPYGQAGMLGQNSELRVTLACATPSPRGRIRASPLGPLTWAGDRARNATPACDTGTAAKTSTKPAQRNAGQHSGYSNRSIHTLHTAEILQLANGCQ